jgi:hypothetical protein
MILYRDNTSRETSLVDEIHKTVSALLRCSFECCTVNQSIHHSAQIVIMHCIHCTTSHKAERIKVNPQVIKNNLECVLLITVLKGIWCLHIVDYTLPVALSLSV